MLAGEGEKEMNQASKGVVREICTLRSVGAGGRTTDSGDPVLGVKLPGPLD